MTAGTLVAQDEAPSGDVALDNLRNLGWFMSQTPRQLELTDEEKAIFMEGFQAGLNGEDGPDDMQAANNDLRNYLNERMEKVNSDKAAKAVGKNKAYFDELDQKEGIQKSESGLYYEIIEEGEAGRATAEDEVTVHYVGKLIDDTTFDSSRARGEPATFPVAGVVPGFSEGVRLIGKGGKIKLYIPSELGYGQRAAGTIPPGSILVFDVEMIDIIRAGGE